MGTQFPKYLIYSGKDDKSELLDVVENVDAAIALKKELKAGCIYYQGKKFIKNATEAVAE